MSLSQQFKKEAEKAHYLMNKGYYISEIDYNENMAFIRSDSIEDFFWNYAGLIDTQKPDEAVDRIEDFYSSHDRMPAAYVTSATEPETFEEDLRERDFSCEATDSWMFWSDGSVEETDLKAEIPKEEQEQKKFVELFSRVYGGAGEDETYGELPEYYLETVRDSLGNDHGPADVQDFVFYSDGKAVGIGTLIIHQKFGGIYNIGVVPDERGNGFGKQIVHFLVRKALQRNTEEIFLQTEKGSSNEEFFRNTGFKTWFTGKIMVKQD